MSHLPTSEEAWCSVHDCRPVECSVTHARQPEPVSGRFSYSCRCCGSAWTDAAVAARHQAACQSTAERRP